jgi:hypothetical protein
MRKLIGRFLLVLLGNDGYFLFQRRVFNFYFEQKRSSWASGRR